MLTAETTTCSADGVIGVDNTCHSQSHGCIKGHDVSHGKTKVRTYLQDQRYMIICHVIVFVTQRKVNLIGMESEQSIIYIYDANRADTVGINMVDLNSVPNESMMVDANVVLSIDGGSNKRLLLSLSYSSIVPLLVFVRL
jgi:hypothetical protein